MSPHFSYSSLELERPSINQEGYALLALHHYVPPSLCMERTRIFQIKYVGNKKVFSQNIQICINHDGRDEITIFNLFQSFRSSSCGEKKTIINLKSNDVVRDCYSAVMKENFFYFFFFFHFLIKSPALLSDMSKWVDIFLSHHRWRRDCCTSKSADAPTRN